jgi:hypothetical protein
LGQSFYLRKNIKVILKEIDPQFCRSAIDQYYYSYQICLSKVCRQ